MIATDVTGLVFDEAEHRYFYEGVEVPGVTSILAPLQDFSCVPRDVLSAASAFGTAVHKACELDDLEVLDEEQLDPELAPYLAAWRRFCRDYEVDWIGIEQQVFHPQLRYAGTLDRRGTLRQDPRREFRVRAIVDIKSSVQLYPAVGPQLAAYHRAADEGNALTKRLAVQLRPDATYVAKWHDDPTDFAVFCSLLTLRNWCAKHQLTPKFQQERA